MFPLINDKRRDGAMLILSRKVGERIQIGDSIAVEVIEASNGRVRIGIEAPREISVRRGELANCTRDLRPQHCQNWPVQSVKEPIVIQDDESGVTLSNGPTCLSAFRVSTELRVILGLRTHVSCWLHNGRIVLSGTVHSREDQRTALLVASRYISGLQIVNRIHLMPDPSATSK